MISRRRWRLFLLLPLLALTMLSPAGVVAQEPAQHQRAARLSLSDVVNMMTEKNAERARALRHYRGRRTYQLDYKGFPKDMQAEMVVEVSYDAPATEGFTVISQSGPKWMIDRVLKRLLETEQESIESENRERVQITSENYNFTLLESRDADDCPYVLGVQPKVPTKFLFRGRIWVDCKGLPCESRQSLPRTRHFGSRRLRFIIPL